MKPKLVFALLLSVFSPCCRSDSDIQGGQPIYAKEFIVTGARGWQIWREDGKLHRCGLWERRKVKEGEAPFEWYGKCDADPEGCTTFVNKYGQTFYLEESCHAK